MAGDSAVVGEVHLVHVQVSNSVLGVRVAGAGVGEEW